LLSGFLADKRVFGREDVDVVAREIREETRAASVAGVEPKPEMVPTVAAPAAVGAAEFGGAAGALDPETVGEVSRLIAGMQATHLEERLTRLERRTDATLGLLQQVLDAIRSRAPAADPVADAPSGPVAGPAVADPAEDEQP
jgi:hypothetical protein